MQCQIKPSRSQCTYSSRVGTDCQPPLAVGAPLVRQNNALSQTGRFMAERGERYTDEEINEFKKLVLKKEKWKKGFSR